VSKPRRPSADPAAFRPARTWPRWRPAPDHPGLGRRWPCQCPQRPGHAAPTTASWPAARHPAHDRGTRVTGEPGHPSPASV